MSLSKLQTLTQFWQEFDLPALQAALDDVATGITARQDTADEGRKALIDGMRQFKRDNDEAVRAAAAPLVKSFQNEVDSLSRRSKAAEKAFFDVYKRLADVADPVPALAQALEAHRGLSRLQDLEIECAQLRETLAGCNKEIAETRGKDKKLQELQTKVEAYDRNIDATLAEKIKGVTERMLGEYNDKLAAVEESKAESERKAAEAEARARTLERQLTEAQSKLFDAENSRMERREAKSEEMDMVMNDLEASQQRAAVAEKELEAARDRLQEVMREKSEEKKLADAESASESEMVSDPRMARELETKEAELKQLVADLQELKQKSQGELEDAHNKCSTLEEEKNAVKHQLLQTELKLETQSDYETVKKELSILKSLEFSQQQGEGETSESRPLEVMILERSKTLQSENTSLRVDKDRLTDELSAAKRELADRTKEAARQEALIVELEDHVARLQDLTAGTNRGEAEGRSSADILVDALNQGLSAKQEEMLFQQHQPSTPTATEKSVGGGDAAALYPIVHAQRERFRQRNEELEEAQSRNQQQIALLQRETEDVKADNVKLYEKIRFLQGFGGSRQSDQSVAVSVESKYRSSYEQKLDPFNSFSNQERQRRYGQLNVFEKIILSFVQFMMSNKSARLFVFAYAVLLHGLVFAVLMKMAYNDAHRRDLAAEWYQKYTNHMEDVHGEENHLIG